MADRQGVGIAYIVSLCGIMSGLAVAMMFCLGMIPGFEYVSPMVAGVLVWIVRERLGVRYGMACFAADHISFDYFMRLEIFGLSTFS